MSRKNKKIKLMVFLPSYAGGGAERVIINFLKFFDSSAIDCSLIVINSKGPLKIKNYNYSLTELHYKRFRNSIFKVFSLIRQKRPDVILSTFPHISILLLIIKKILFLKFKLIVREPNLISKSLAEKKLMLLRLLHSIFMRYSDHVIVTSLAMYREAVNLGISKDVVEIIRNPVDAVKIRNQAKPIRYPGEGIRLIGVGRMVYQKGFDRIISMISKFSNIHLVLIGDGSELKKLKQLTIKYGIQNRVKFLGYIHNPYSYISGADYFVLPSRWEGLPNVALEALTLGTPVITFSSLVGLQDYKGKFSDGSIIFCDHEKEMEIVFSKLESRNDYLRPKLKKSLIKFIDSPKVFSKKVEKIISSIV